MSRDKAISDAEASHHVALFLTEILTDTGKAESLCRKDPAMRDLLADIGRVNEAYVRLATRNAKPVDPVAMLLWCPSCHTRHIDGGEWVARPHKTHQCQACGLEWCPARVHTVGVQVLPSIDKG